MDYEVTLTLNEIAMAIASLEVTIEDAVIAAMAGDQTALTFVEPLEALIGKLREVRYGA